MSRVGADPARHGARPPTRPSDPVLTRVARQLIDRFRLLRTAVKSPRAQVLIRVARRCRIVQDPARFIVLELAASRGRAATYRLAQTPDIRLVVRHRTRDVDILDEIFGRLAAYAPPPAALEALASRGSPRVLDLGGNVGFFGAYALARFPGAKVTSIEPDPFNLPLLRRCAELNAPERWQIVEACALSYTGTVAFEAGQYADSHVAEPAAGRVLVPGVDVLPLLADADLVKMDIEGSEWPILLDPRFKETLSAAACVLEWHERGCPSPRPADAAAEAFRQAGYEVLPGPSGPWDHGALWAWRP